MNNNRHSWIAITDDVDQCKNCNIIRLTNEHIMTFTRGVAKFVRKRKYTIYFDKGIKSKTAGPCFGPNKP